MNKTVEAVARRILGVADKGGIILNEYTDATPEQVAEDFARAAIAAHIDAMMEPSGNILTEGVIASMSIHDPDSIDYWCITDEQRRTVERRILWAVGAMLTAHKKEVLG